MTTSEAKARFHNKGELLRTLRARAASLKDQGITVAPPDGTFESPVVGGLSLDRRLLPVHDVHSHEAHWESRLVYRVCRTSLLHAAQEKVGEG